MKRLVIGKKWPASLSGAFVIWMLNSGTLLFNKHDVVDPFVGSSVHAADLMFGPFYFINL